MNWNRELTLENCIVLMPGVFGHSGDPITDDVKNQLDDLHKEKIRIADFIIVLDVGGYIGSSTREEIGYAKALHKPIYYLSDLEIKEK